ncbi:MAG: hypothetical protein BWK76_13160 [Desulfobulbaceae bacterium A2]|nr:MAG: hypothetical protein BWK76_13160 [Desulfobulbaceae bacterium A2]
MHAKPDLQQASFIERLWHPFFNLSVYGKYAVGLVGFLVCFLLLGQHEFGFVRWLKHQIDLLATEGNTLTDLGHITLQADQTLFSGGLLVVGIMCFVSLMSFLPIRRLVLLMRDISGRLQELRSCGGDASDCLSGEMIPVLGRDEISAAVWEVNGLLEDIQAISLYRRTIEADETSAEIYQRLAQVFTHHLGLKTFAIWETAETGDAITLAYCQPPDLAPEICRLTTANSCRAKRTGEVVSSRSFPLICPVFPQPDALSHYCVPMLVGGKVLGVVQFLFNYVDSGERAESLRQSAEKARHYLRETLPVLHAKRLAQSLQEMATRDTLTGLYNRRFLEGNINPLVASIRRRKTQLGVLMCDMDYFKQVNDEHGHEVGDFILASLAAILQNGVRESDMVVRYGGEEFLILLNDCQEGHALQVADKIRQEVEKHQFRTGGISLHKTISIGVSEFPGDTGAFWEGVKFADVALYRAKEEGRNRVVRFAPAMWQGKDY